MVLYILLSALFLLVLALSVVEQKRTSRELKKLQKELSALNELSTQHELWKSAQKQKMSEDLKLSRSTQKSQNTIQPETYEEYLKNGKTDNPLTWLYGTGDKRLFP